MAPPLVRRHSLVDSIELIAGGPQVLRVLLPAEDGSTAKLDILWLDTLEVLVTRLCPYHSFSVLCFLLQDFLPYVSTRILGPSCMHNDTTNPIIVPSFCDPSVTPQVQRAPPWTTLVREPNNYNPPRPLQPAYLPLCKQFHQNQVQPQQHNILFFNLLKMISPTRADNASANRRPQSKNCCRRLSYLVFSEPECELLAGGIKELPLSQSSQPN